MSSLSFLALTVVTILNRSGREEMVCRAGLFWSSESGTCGNGGAVSVEDVEDVSDGEDVDQMKP